MLKQPDKHEAASLCLKNPWTNLGSRNTSAVYDGIAGEYEMRQRMKFDEVISIFCIVAMLTSVLGLPGCKAGPEVSSLPSAEIAPPGTTIPELPKGDVYDDEEVLRPNLRISPGDTVEVGINQEDVEEKLTSVVNDSGLMTVGFLKIPVAGLTAAEVEARVQKHIAPYYLRATVQVQIKMKKVKVKRVFIFGDVKNPGMIPMPRNMTVLQAIGRGLYNETAKLDQVRVIRYSPKQRTILTADLSRLFTYGDWSRNLPLLENDIVFVPRSRLGDAKALAETLGPSVYMAISPLFGAFVIKTLISP